MGYDQSGNSSWAHLLDISWLLICIPPLPYYGEGQPVGAHLEPADRETKGIGRDI